jgi:hypothetical protein
MASHRLFGLSRDSLFSCPLFIGYGTASSRVPIASLVLLTLAVLSLPASAWNIPGHDIRRTDKQYDRGPWHYINWPFKPEGQPASVQIREPEPVNILTAMAENESVAKNGSSDAERRAIALAWLFHLVGDIQQPNAVQLFAVDYPNGDRGGNQICIRVTHLAISVNTTLQVRNTGPNGGTTGQLRLSG